MSISDAASIEGKTPQAASHVPALVVGAGAAGLAAATTLAKLGIAAMLIEEQPVPSGLLSLDVPLFFGQRMAGSRGNARMMQQILDTNVGIAEAYELGIDVQLGVCAWAIFPRQPAGSESGAPFLVGLADEEHAWFVSCDRLIVAAGARDLCVGFPGWEKPGVMGALAAMQLIERYDAFTGSRLLVLGAGELGVRVAEVAATKGATIAGIVDIDAAPSASDERSPRIEALGAPVYARHMIQEARGTAEVSAAVIVGLDEAQSPIAGTQTTLSCDTIVLAIGTVPNVELLDSLDCRLQFVPSRGGWVPQCDADGATSLTGLYAVGDCAGLGGDPVDEGQRAARATAASLGADPIHAGPVPKRTPLEDQSVSRLGAWLRAQIEVSGLDVSACLCEEVTRREILELRAPRYVPASAEQRCPRDLQALGKEGPLNQDQVKRLTRAGMGPCQGRRCREQVQTLIEQVAGSAPGSVPLAHYRPPVRPLPMNVLAADFEEATLRDHWVAWFNISTQWLPHWEPRPVPLDAASRPPIMSEGE